ncbi:MAG: sterol desaturase family protein [Bacteroidia bacterium]
MTEKEVVQEITNNILYNASYLKIYFLVVVYFLFLYFVVGALFLEVCKYLYRKNSLHKIVEKEVTKKQIKFEIKHSLQSIFIFGFSAFPIIYLISAGDINLLPDTFLNVLVGLVILTLWNEIHFFIVHRILHIRFFMRHVHFVHHTSNIPTVYSVYSFHWLEALLLSTVPLTIVPFISFSPIAILLYPFASILLNYAGHCNYRFGNGTGVSCKLFGTHHNEHHFKAKKNYGFALSFLDKLYALFIKNK